MTDDTEKDDIEPWTQAGAARLLAAADELAAAIRAHAAAISAVAGRKGLDEVFEAGGTVLPKVLAYADAQFDYTGTAWPFGSMHEIDPDNDDDEDEDEGQRPTSGVSVLQRTDLAVTDEIAVLAAGRAAYGRVWPDDDAEDAARDVTHLGRALYQLAHSDGWDNLDEVEGLEVVGRIVLVHRQDELLGEDPEEWPEEPFHMPGEALQSQFDAYA